MDEPITEDRMNRAFIAERLLTDEKFRSRDEAVRLLVASSKDDQAKYMAIAALLLAAVTLFLKLMGK